MTDLEQGSNVDLDKLEHLMQAYSSPIEMKGNVPKVNLKRVKLNKLQNLDGALRSKNITTVSLTDSLENLNLPIKRITDENQGFDESALLKSPLRKKGEIKKETVSEPIAKNVTFNLEAQIVQDDENVILSPSIISLPPLNDDVISSSGDKSSYVWPPVTQKSKDAPSEYLYKKKTKNKKIKKGKEPSTKRLKKPYFISEKQAEVPAKVLPVQEKQPIIKIEKISLDEHNKEIEEIQSSAFPWGATPIEQLSVDDIFHGGLESELVDTPKDTVIESVVEKPVINETINDFNDDEPFKINRGEQNTDDLNVLYNQDEKPTQTPIFKAVKSEIPPDLYSDVNSSINGIELQGKASKMFDNYNTNSSGPIKVIILGGLTITLAYLVWSYLLPNLQTMSTSTNESSYQKVVVRDLFNKKNKLTKGTALNPKLVDEKTIEAGKTTEVGKTIEEPLPEQDPNSISPITENDRLTLIQRAREAIQGRLDPFGQEEVLPYETIAKKKEEDAPPKPLPDIELQRKQVELVGVISTKDKNLALVNVYTVDYAVRPEDEKEAREVKLKAALSMAVPNRVEVSLLDPVEDWYVKQIVKSKSKNEDPTINLVKGDKKFKLRVGQKVLLPEEKVLNEVNLEENDGI